MSRTLGAVELTAERIAEIKAWPIDLSDIPEMTREEFAHCLVRLPNQPIGKGGEWHKPVMPADIPEEARQKIAELVQMSESETECTLQQKAM